MNAASAKVAGISHKSRRTRALICEIVSVSNSFVKSADFYYGSSRVHSHTIAIEFILGAISPFFINNYITVAKTSIQFFV